MSQLVHFTLYIVTALAIGALTRRLFDGIGKPAPPAVPLLAGTIYLLIPASMIIATWPNVDHATALFFLLSMHALLLAMRFRAAGYFAIAGATAGGAFATKYTAAPHVLLIAGIALIWFFQLRRKPEIQSAVPRFSALVLGLIAAVAIAGPWLVKNYVLTANPVYPLAYTHFQQREWGPSNAALYKLKADDKGSTKTLAELPLSPVKATFHWTDYETHNVETWPLMLLVSAASVLVVTKRSTNRNEITLCVCTGLFYWLTWFFSYQSNRMLLPFIALLLPVAAITFSVLFAVDRLLKQVLMVALFAGIFHGGAWAVQWMYVGTVLSPPPLPYLLGGMSRDLYERKSLNYAGAFKALNDRVKPGETVLLIGEHRIYGARFRAIWSDWYDTPAIVQIIRENKIRTEDELSQFLRKTFTRIFINDSELGPQLSAYFRPRFSDTEWQLVEDLMAGRVEGYDNQPASGAGKLLHRNEVVGDRKR